MDRMRMKKIYIKTKGNDDPFVFPINEEVSTLQMILTNGKRHKHLFVSKGNGTDFLTRLCLARDVMEVGAQFISIGEEPKTWIDPCDISAVWFGY